MNPKIKLGTAVALVGMVTSVAMPNAAYAATKSAAEVMQDIVNYSELTVGSLVGLHQAGSTIYRIVEAVREAKGEKKDEAITFSKTDQAKVGDYISSQGKLRYVATIVDKSNKMVGTALIVTTAPGPHSYFMNVIARVHIGDTLYLFEQITVNALVDGPLQVTLPGIGKKAKQHKLKLLFGGRSVIGAFDDYSIEGETLPAWKKDFVWPSEMPKMTLTIDGLKDLGQPKRRMLYNMFTGRIFGSLKWGKTRGKVEGVMFSDGGYGTVTVDGKSYPITLK